MSKTTAILLTILIIVIGILFFIIYGTKNPIIRSINTPEATSSTPADATTLSLTTNSLAVSVGQTVTVAVLIHDPHPHPELAQFELSYDPMEITVDAVLPGTFFTYPTVILQNIDSVAGRISYALRCPATSTEDCVNAASSTLATMKISINPYAAKNTTTLSFLPKTVVRIDSGKNILKKTRGLQLTLTKSLTPIFASPSAIASPGANYTQGTPVH